jgi:hypothetical protein
MCDKIGMRSPKSSFLDFGYHLTPAAATAGVSFFYL